MASWGQGDPRWLVNDLGTTNPNDWHWTDKNKLSWSQAKLKELLCYTHPVNNDHGKITFTQLSECKGEAYLTRRKGNKKFAFFELTLKLDWEGIWEAGADKVIGAVNIKEFASFHDEDDIIVDSTVNSKGEHETLLLACVRELHPKILTALKAFAKELDAQEQ